MYQNKSVLNSLIYNCHVKPSTTGQQYTMVLSAFLKFKCIMSGIFILFDNICLVPYNISWYTQEPFKFEELRYQTADKQKNVIDHSKLFYDRTKIVRFVNKVLWTDNKWFVFDLLLNYQGCKFCWITQECGFTLYGYKCTNFCYWSG